MNASTIPGLTISPPEKVNGFFQIDLPNIPSNLNNLIEIIDYFPVPCDLRILGQLIKIRTQSEKKIFSLGLEIMWYILDDRTRGVS